MTRAYAWPKKAQHLDPTISSPPHRPAAHEASPHRFPTSREVEVVQTLILQESSTDTARSAEHWPVPRAVQVQQTTTKREASTRLPPKPCACLRSEVQAISRSQRKVPTRERSNVKMTSQVHDTHRAPQHNSYEAFVRSSSGTTSRFSRSLSQGRIPQAHTAT